MFAGKRRARYRRPMPRQILYFVTDSAVRIEVHAREDLGGLAVELRFNPPRDDPAITPADVDEAADVVEAEIRRHLEEHGAVLKRIVIRHDLEPLTYRHLGRYAVPLLPEAPPST